MATKPPPYPAPSDRGVSRTEQFKAATTAVVKAISQRARPSRPLTSYSAGRSAAAINKVRNRGETARTSQRSGMRSSLMIHRWCGQSDDPATPGHDDLTRGA